MELIEAIQLVVQKNQHAMQPADLTTGTVTSAAPLEITTSTGMAPLRAGVLYLTAAVVEKKIPILQHTHTCPGGATGPALEDISCTEHGKPLPVKDGFIILNRGLEAGDKVLLLKVQRGQRYVVLSRIFQ